MECLSTLIACGGNTNLTDKFGQTPLHLVAKIGDVDASIVLLEGNATVDATDKVKNLFPISTHVPIYTIL